MFKIERATAALFQLLNLRSMGSLPQDVAEWVQPTLDLGPWALQANPLRVTQLCPSQSAAAGAGLYATFVQPRDWLVQAVQGLGQATNLGDLCLPYISLVVPGQTERFVIAGVNRWGAIGAMSAGGASEIVLTQAQMPFNAPFFTPSGTLWQTFASLVNVAFDPLISSRVMHYDL